MEKLLAIILTAAIVFYVLKLLGRLLMPFLLKRFFRRMGGNFDTAETGQTTEEGDVTIQFSKQQRGKQRLSDELGGEYVDYEEIK